MSYEAFMLLNLLWFIPMGIVYAYAGSVIEARNRKKIKTRRKSKAARAKVKK